MREIVATLLLVLGKPLEDEVGELGEEIMLELVMLLVVLDDE